MTTPTIIPPSVPATVPASALRLDVNPSDVTPDTDTDAAMVPATVTPAKATPADAAKAKADAAKAALATATATAKANTDAAKAKAKATADAAKADPTNAKAAADAAKAKANLAKVTATGKAKIDAARAKASQLADAAKTAAAKAKADAAKAKADAANANVPPITPRMAELENVAAHLLGQTITDAKKLANTLFELYPLQPWLAHKLTIKAYFAGLGIRADNFHMPTDARRELVKAMYTRDAETDAEHIAWMTAAGVRTIARDRSELGFTNKNRTDAQREAKLAAAAAKRDADAAEKAAADDAAKADAAKADGRQVMSLPQLIAATDDINELSFWRDLISARISELATVEA